jgi:hypothetical protein
VSCRGFIKIPWYTSFLADKYQYSTRAGKFLRGYAVGRTFCDAILWIFAKALRIELAAIYFADQSGSF